MITAARPSSPRCKLISDRPVPAGNLKSCYTMSDAEMLTLEKNSVAVETSALLPAGPMTSPKMDGTSRMQMQAKNVGLRCSIRGLQVLHFVIRTSSRLF